MKRKVFYVTGEQLIQQTNRIPVVIDRASMVHALIESYGLLEHMIVVQSKKASIEDLKLCHSSGYIECLKNLDEEDCTEVNDEQVEYGLGYDCPPVENMLDLVSELAGGSLTAAECLVNNENSIAINWCGGWHHANRDEAEGFCYVNDIVIAIEKIRQKYPKVLYIDLDIHHGNGVESSYSYTKRVFTLSFHKYEPGFYPCTGSVNDIGFGNGKGYSCNVPMKQGVSDNTLIKLFENIAPEVFKTYQPDAIVVQCGGDCLNGDPLGESNITFDSFKTCTVEILKWNKPTLFLGGGGYNKANTARLWTQITGIVTEQIDNMSIDIPDHKYFLEYRSGYELTISKGFQKDTNCQEYIDYLIKTIKSNLNTLKYL